MDPVLGHRTIIDPISKPGSSPSQDAQQRALRQGRQGTKGVVGLGCVMIAGGQDMVEAVVRLLDGLR